MSRITFDLPQSMELVKERYNMSRVSILTTANIYPLVKGVEFKGDASFILAKKKAFPIKRKMDAHIEEYHNSMLRNWKEVKSKIKSLINSVKEVSKVDYNNKLTVSRIAKIPTQYKKQFSDVADTYDLNLAILDAIVLNPSIMVNARYDNRNNFMEFNPAYLEQHGMIRLGDEGEEISETSKTFIHEFGHAYWYNSLSEEERMTWQGLATFLERGQLKGDMSQYLIGEKKRFDGSTLYSNVYTLRDEPFVSVYARFTTREDFAECFLYYKVAPKTLLRTNPNKYAFLQDKIGNKIEKENLTKAFEPEIEDPKKLRDKIIAYLDSLKDDLSREAQDAIIVAYLLGKQKAAHYTGEVYNPELSASDKEEIQRLVAQNDEYLDGFMDTLSEEHDNTLFDLAPTGFIEGVKEYDDIDEFDQEFDGVMDNQEYRLGSYALNGLENALAIGMIAGLGGVFVGGYWHTEEDDKVCDDCGPLDGQWMSLDEFSAICVDEDGIHPNCRCKRLFEPAFAPGDDMQLMIKGGPGSGRYPVGSTTKLSYQEQADYDKLPEASKADYMDHRRTGMDHESALAFAEPDKAYVKKSGKVVAVDYHGTIMINDKVNETIKAKLQEMRDEGYHIIVYTSGTTDSPGAYNGIQTWLKQNQIPFDEIWQRQGKPDADIYFEDKAIRPSEVEGKTLTEIENLPKKEDKLNGG
jgi:hypothetical protein